MNVRSTDPPVRQQGLREHNLAVVLLRIADSATTLSRADVAAVTGLTRATVSSLVDSLIDSGLITELAPPPRTGAGRPANGLAIAASGAAAIGLEINVDYVAACVVDLTGALRHRSVVIEDQRRLTPGQAIAGVAELAHSALAVARLEGLPVTGITLAVPGLVDAPNGPLRIAPNLGWRDLDVVAMLDDALKSLGSPNLPLSVDNEANLAAVAEHAAHRRDGLNSFLYLSGDIGVGAGIVLAGELFRGTRGWGGEIGHFPVDRTGPLCTCGARGCLEQYAGQEAILRRANTDNLRDAAEAGEPQTLAALHEAGVALGVAVSGALNVIDVHTVVLGGIYAGLARWLVPALEAGLLERVVSGAWAPVTIRVSTLGGDAAILGGAGSILRAVLENPAATLG